MKEIEKNTYNGKTCSLTGRINAVKMPMLPGLITGTCNPHQNSGYVIHRNKKKILKNSYGTTKVLK
jgi:hypothetical protein